MKILWTFNIDAQCYFRKAEYIFEFEGKNYRLIRGTEEECDKLMTVSEDTLFEKNECIERTRRLLDSLSWELNTGFSYVNSTFKPITKQNFMLEKARVMSFYERNMRALIVDINTITPIDSDMQKFALSLWNEAENTKSPFLAFINYWRILEIPYVKGKKGAPGKKTISWIKNNINSNNTPDYHELEKIAKNKRKDIGKYLYDECRHAIAHVTKPNALRPCRIEDIKTISKIKWIIKSIAGKYIVSELKLSPYSKALKIKKTKKRTKALKELQQLRKYKKSNRNKFINNYSNTKKRYTNH